MTGAARVWLSFWRSRSSGECEARLAGRLFGAPDPTFHNGAKDGAPA